MRVHSLEMTAFGPFAGTEVIDFEPLNNAGVFLLTGPTGAGKTSILDAICFGLFGQVPGVRDKAKNYRSHHAPDGRAPRIVLEVTLQGRRFRITRQPSWERPSRRARSGYVEEKARAGIEELVGGRWVARSSRADEVGHLVTGLVGLNRDQFCQVVLLAQGEFQTFLRAGGRDRQRLLESLFGTQRFQAVERWLVEHRREQSRRFQEQADALDTLAARLLEVCTPLAAEEQFGIPETVSGCAELLSEAQRLLASGEEAVEEAAERLDAALTAGKHAQHAYDEARACADLRRRHVVALRRSDELTAAADLVATREERVRRSRSADALLPVVQHAAEADAAVCRAVQAVTGVLSRDAASERLRLDTTAPVPTPAEVARVLAGLLDRTARLAELRTVEQECDALARLIETDSRERTILVARRDLLDSQRRAHPGRITVLLAQLSTEVAAVDRGADIEDRLARARSTLSAAHQVEALDAQRSELEGRRRAALSRVLAATERWLDAKERLLAGVAAELAGRLRDGETCPVCGSPSHPFPAEVTDSHVGTQQEAELYTHVTATREALADLDRRIEAGWAARAKASTSSNALTVAHAQRVLDDTLADQAAAATAAGRKADLAAELRRIEAEAHEQQAELDSLTQECVRTDERLEGLQRRRQSGLERLSDAVGAGCRVEPILQEARRQHARCVELDSAVREHRHAERAAGRADARLGAALAASPFDSAADVLASTLSSTEAASLEALNLAHAAELEACLRELRDPVLHAAAESSAPDLDTLSAAAAECNARAAEAAGRASAVHRRQLRLEELVTELERGAARLEPLRAAKELAETVAGICCGSSADNPTRTALSHYVLGARLSQVVAAANARLAGICSGRYQLEHTMLRGAGDQRGGLGLVVHDAHTDRARDPATLSGGESFYVSLSLALGLADVVTTEAGGAELATLFVDEGFGGLDDETREEVLDELDGLRSGGRTIGLVSHLSELRARIPAQLHVVMGAHGSTCRPHPDECGR